VDPSPTSIVEKTIAHDAQAEEELVVVLRELVPLSVERPGGVSVEELARKLGRDDDRHGVRELLERGRSAIEDTSDRSGRFAVVERVHDDISAFWRARYIPTSFGRIYLKSVSEDQS